MFNRYFCCVIVATALLGRLAFAQQPFPNGTWSDARERIIVHVAPCGADLYCGTIVRDNRPGRSTNPPGYVLAGHVRRSGSVWQGIARDGNQQASFTIHQVDNDRAILRVCMLGVLCFQERVQRVAPQMVQATAVTR